MAQKPLMLKDYLELDSCSESFWWAPLQRAGGTSVRRLLEAELGGGGADKGGWRLVRSRSKGALTRLTAIIKLLQFSTEEGPVASADAVRSGGPPRLLPRSFSKKLRRSFWKKRDHEKEEKVKVMVKDIVRLSSFDEETVERSSLFYPSPVISRSGSSSGYLFSTATSELFVDGKDSMPISPRTEKGVFVGPDEESRRPSTGCQEPEEICGKVDMDCPFEEEKEQLSPVSVMDFPYQDEDEDEAVVEQPSAISPCFEQSIINIERTKNQLLQMIRRFETLANLEPVDLDHRFACTEAFAQTTVHVETDGEEEGNENEERRRRRGQRTASALLRQITDNYSLPACGEKLLFDFFVEGLSFDEDCWRGKKRGCAGNEDLLRLASDWVAGAGSLAEKDGDVAVREMERCCKGWNCFDEEEEIVAVEMTGGVVTWLMDELVDDLLVSVA
ncbi:hypothetical protein IEQ34_014316 [Dendrobium chrysotoxum]|uniref:DUF4378 domain-containing protein n=1 Tax=Dendrobium chrysotoxum TaxID=161865 RepID=A0AAV7GLN3_DENCH|nr:hypothetical protein IEQ34_014316 [Dendrobium chrysotoxum]